MQRVGIRLRPGATLPMARRHILGSRLMEHRRITQITTGTEAEGTAAGGISVVAIGDVGVDAVVGAETGRGLTRGTTVGEGEDEVEDSAEDGEGSFGREVKGYLVVMMGEEFSLDGWETLPAVMVARGCLIVMTVVIVCPKIKGNAF